MVLGMKHSLGIEAIKARKLEIDEQIAILRQEAGELDVALRVFQRFAEPGTSEPEEETKLGPPRPKGVPTLFQMAYEVIRDAEAQGKKGIMARQIVEEIGKRYWPGVKPQQIVAPLYRMAKKGRFRKLDNGLFQTVRTKEAPAEKSESASKPEGQGVSSAGDLL